MRSFLIAVSAAATLFTGTTHAQAVARVSVLHGVPGLGKAVDVFADGNKLFSFDYGDAKGPLELAPATYALEVKLDGKAILDAKAAVEGGKSYTVAAHLLENTGARLTAFVDDTSDAGRSKARLTVRHLADAPAVDVEIKRWFWPSRPFKDVRNGQQGSAELYAGTYEVSLFAAGTKTRAFGPVKLSLDAGKLYAVHAIGDLADKNFRLAVLTRELGTEAGMLGATVTGKACGGAIGVSTGTPAFGKPFDVTLSGATPDGIALLHTGTSDERLLFLRLPLDLGFLGLKGCSLYQNTPWIQVLRTDAKGTARIPVTIPTSMARGFGGLYFQYSFVATGKNSLGLLLTDSVAVESN